MGAQQTGRNDTAGSFHEDKLLSVKKHVAEIYPNFFIGRPGGGIQCVTLALLFEECEGFGRFFGHRPACKGHGINPLDASFNGKMWLCQHSPRPKTSLVHDEWIVQED